MAAARIGALAAEHLVVTRPRGVLANVAPSDLPQPEAPAGPGHAEAGPNKQRPDSRGSDGLHRLAHRVRRLFG